jgi:hypothetical protein
MVARMAPIDPNLAAEPGSLSPTILADLLLVRDWQVIWDREMAALFGADFADSTVLRALVIFCLTEFGQGRKWGLKAHQDHCAHLASRATIRNDALRLVNRKLFLMSEVPEDRRITLVEPTGRLVAWAMEAVPRMEREFIGIFAARGGVSL